MGEQISCCNGKDQYNNTNGLSAFQPNVPIQFTKPNPSINVPTIPPMTNNMKELIQRVKKYKYFKGNQQNKNNIKQTVVYNKNSQYALYEGQTNNNTADGYGAVGFTNRSYFEGIFQKGEPLNGVFVFNQTCYYVGDIQNFQASGQGIYENIQNGYYYEGQWKKNLQHGNGIQKYANKDQYKGGFMCGSKFGQGQYKFSDGKIYIGSFYNGHSDGIGKLSLPNGDSYEGQWKLGQMHGQGTYKWKNGQKYEGQYINGAKSNKGKYYFAGGALYDGQWLNGFQDGEGSIKQGYDEVFGMWRAGQKIN